MRTKTILISLSVIAGSMAVSFCKHDSPTKILVKNSDTATTMTVNVVGGGQTFTFTNVAPNSTSAGVEVSFSGQVSVSCTNSACKAGNVTIEAEKDNTITVSATADPGGTSGTGGGGGGW